MSEIKNQEIKKVTFSVTEEGFFNGYEVVECPYCSSPRNVEPDATYEVICEDCGERYKVVSLIF